MPSSSESASAPRERARVGLGLLPRATPRPPALLCFGPPQGARVTFVHPDDWLGPQRQWEPEEALREVARRYATTYGPVGTAAVPRVVRLARTSTLDVLGAAPTAPAPAASVRLLPEYDPYVMGFREREQLVPPEVREQIKAHGKGRYEGPAGTPFLLVDGLCAGIWRRRKKRRSGSS